MDNAARNGFSYRTKLFPPCCSTYLPRCSRNPVARTKIMRMPQPYFPKAFRQSFKRSADHKIRIPQWHLSTTPQDRNNIIESRTSSQQTLAVIYPKKAQRRTCHRTWGLRYRHLVNRWWERYQTFSCADIGVSEFNDEKEGIELVVMTTQIEFLCILITLTSITMK